MGGRGVRDEREGGIGRGCRRMERFRVREKDKGKKGEKGRKMVQER